MEGGRGRERKDRERKEEEGGRFSHHFLFFFLAFYFMELCFSVFTPLTSHRHGNCSSLY